MAAPVLFHTVNAILEVLNNKRHENSDAVQELLKVYNNVFEENKKNVGRGNAKKYPFIVLEGLDGCGKSSVGWRLCKQLQAKQWRTPPKSIGHLRELFDGDNILRTAYYSLGNYIAALEVEILLKQSPVVMDRYWHSTTAYAIAQAVQDYPEQYKLPPDGDKIYFWPNDLIKPDIVLFLDVTEEVRLERHSRRNNVTIQENLLKSSDDFRQNVLQAYKNMQQPGLEKVNANISFSYVLNEIGEKTRHLF